MMANKTTSKPRLEIVIEPETKVRFRYESEGGSHGGLTGKKAGKKKSFPAVKLVDYNKKKQVFVKVSLYTEDYEQHVLELKGSKGNVSFLEEPLGKDNTASFANIKILNKKLEDVCMLLMSQKLAHIGKNLNHAGREKFKKNYDKETKERAKKIRNSVRLCFEVFEEGNNQNRLCDPLFSDVISNQRTSYTGELRIHRMSKISGSWRGGDEVILLCDRVQKEYIKIEFYETDTNGCIIWEKPALFTTADVHYQVAITFKTPEYKENAHKNVFVHLARGEDYSEPLEFTYISDFVEKPLKKRKLNDSGKSDNSSFSQLMENDGSNELDESFTEHEQDLTDLLIWTKEIEELSLGFEEDELQEKAFNLSSDDLILDARSMLPQFGFEIDGGGFCERLSKLSLDIDKGKEHDKQDIPHSANKSCNIKLPAVYHEKILKEKINSLLLKRNKFGNTLLHIAVLSDKNISTLLSASQLADVDIINAQNFNQETALHIATKLNKAAIVMKLLQANSNPNQKNKEGNNCYHIASENSCLPIMYNLLSCVACGPQLDALNYAGLSPLHLAIKNKSEGCYNLLKIHSENVSMVEKGRGRSLLHYAVEYWPSFVTTLLKDKETLDLLNVQDFEGNTPLHLACSFENVEVVKQLLEAGADPFLSNYKQRPNEEQSSGEMAADLSTNDEILEILQKASSNISVSEEVIVELCKLLDVNEQWKCLALYFVEEKFIKSLQLSPNPTKALLNHIKKENKKDFIETLKNGIEMAELEEASMIFKQKTL